MNYDEYSWPRHTNHFDGGGESSRLLANELGYTTAPSHYSMFQQRCQLEWEADSFSTHAWYQLLRSNEGGQDPLIPTDTVAETDCITLCIQPRDVYRTDRKLRATGSRKRARSGDMVSEEFPRYRTITPESDVWNDIKLLQKMLPNRALLQLLQYIKLPQDIDHATINTKKKDLTKKCPCNHNIKKNRQKQYECDTYGDSQTTTFGAESVTGIYVLHANASVKYRMSSLQPRPLYK